MYNQKKIEQKMQTPTNNPKTCLISAFLLLISFGIFAQNQSKKQATQQFSTQKPAILSAETDTQTSYRGVSSFADSLVWLAGSNGVVAKSADFGRSFRLDTLPAAKGLSLRAVQLLDAKTALVMSSGFESRIFKTIDAGATWQTVFSRNDSAIFLDALIFYNDTLGYCLGDPINGKFLLLRTTDSGSTWKMDSANAPPALPNEAAFAASNTSFGILPNGTLVVATGGATARILTSTNWGETWQSQTINMLQGNSSQGIFGLAVRKNKFVAVGGDYLQPNQTAYTSAAGILGKQKTVVFSELPYQSAVVFYAENKLLSTGPAGTFRSLNGGKTWQPENDLGFNCLTISAKGKYIYAAGSKGVIAVFRLRE